MTKYKIYIRRHYLCLYCCGGSVLYTDNRITHKHEYNEIGLVYDKAIADHTQAIALFTDDTDKAVAHTWRGEAYEKQGKRTQAEADFAKEGN